jgi:3'(2'), 5'-bisphosphate nucleotidase
MEYVEMLKDFGPILGVIYFPATETLYYAAKNQGAFKCLADEESQQIQTRHADPGKLVLALSRRRRGPMLTKFLDQVGSHRAMVHGGCLKSCLVAEGAADAYPCFGPTYEWDTAAAQIILTEAGGALLDLNFNPLKYNFEESLINPSFIAVGDPNYHWRHWLPEL